VSERRAEESMRTVVNVNDVELPQPPQQRPQPNLFFIAPQEGDTLHHATYPPDSTGFVGQGIAILRRGRITKYLKLQHAPPGSDTLRTSTAPAPRQRTR